ncbi:RNA polymerase III-inhibiting protein maf1 [Lecanora helva]
MKVRIHKDSPCWYQWDQLETPDEIICTLTDFACPQFLPLPEMERVSDALSFDTHDCHIVGNCEIYTTKAGRRDKKLYKAIDQSLESQYASTLRLSASLSTEQAELYKDSLNLSRTSPFGPLSHPPNRKAFAYAIATLNAAHQDYLFTDSLRPEDFRKESIGNVMVTLDSTLNSLRTTYVSTLQEQSTKWLNANHSTVPQTPNGSEKWNPHMWRMIDNEMVLKDCSVYQVAPGQDILEGEYATLWSNHYLFFNKAKKRVCYLYLRGIMSFKGSLSGFSTTLSMKKRPASVTWSLDEEPSPKQARYLLGDRASEVGFVDDEDEAFGPEWNEDAKDKPIREPSITEIDAESPCKGKSSRGSSKTSSDKTSKEQLGHNEELVAGISEEVVVSVDE